MRSIAVLIALFLTSCGYRFEHATSFSEDGPATISIPYVEGDVNGQLTDQLIKAFSASGDFRFSYQDGRLQLRVVLVDRHAEPIGWRYEKKENGKLEDQLIAVEGRRFISAEVQLIDSATDEVLYGPTTITAAFDYDYFEPNVVQDLSFVDPFGVRQSSVQFSLGQLDASEGAYDDVFIPVAQRLAKKIVDRIVRASY